MRARRSRRVRSRPASSRARVEEYHTAEVVSSRRWRGRRSRNRRPRTDGTRREGRARGHAPGRTWAVHVLPSVESQPRRCRPPRPLPAGSDAAIISWPPPESTCMSVQARPSRECQAVAMTSVGDEPRLLPMTTSPPWPSSEMPGPRTAGRRCRTPRAPRAGSTSCRPSRTRRSWSRLRPRRRGGRSGGRGSRRRDGCSEHEQLGVEGREVRPKSSLAAGALTVPCS